MSAPWNYERALAAKRQANQRLNAARRAALVAYGPAHGPHTGTRSGAFYASPHGQAARHSHFVAVGPVVAARHAVRNRNANVRATRNMILQWAHWPQPQTQAQAVAAANQILNLARRNNTQAVQILLQGGLPPNLVLKIMGYVRQ